MSPFHGRNMRPSNERDSNDHGRPVFPKERAGKTSWSDGADHTGSATGKDLLHTRGYGGCSRFTADPLLWKCG